MAKKLASVHPGEILRDELEERGLSANALARALRVPVNRVTEILNGKRAITADTAHRLARYFGTSAQMWMNLQMDYELDTVDPAKIRREVLPFAS
ncbi:MAG: HigA family addiction module antitoxin [Bryobacteraceae bacterium]